MSLALQVRDAVPGDAETIVEFNMGLARETEDHELARDSISAGVSRLLADRDKGRYFVAESGGRIVGQLMITFEWSDWRNGQFWWLQSVYVAPGSRNRGVFSALLDHVKELAGSDPEVCGLRLYVENENAAARSAYRARGFGHPGYEVMEAVF